jgi:hypothetical protein
MTGGGLSAHRITLVWLVLVLATGVSWWLGTGVPAGASGSRLVATALLLVVAFVKVRLIVRHFMEVERAPLALRIATDAWIVVVGLALLAFYLRSAA